MSFHPEWYAREARDGQFQNPSTLPFSQPVTEAGQQPGPLPILTNEQVAVERHRKHLASFADLEESKRAVALTRIANRNPNTARAYKNAHREWRVSLVLY
jgi:hypothetical protein